MKKKLLVIIILFAVYSPLFADRLSMDSFIRKILESHPQLEIFSETENTSKIKAASAVSMEKWIYSLKPFINYFGEASAYQYKSSSTTQYGSELSIKTPLGLSGGEIGISGAATVDFNDPLSSEQSEELYKQSLSVFYKQSLIKNMGLKESKLLEQEYLDDYKIIKLNNMELTEKIILEFSNLYLEWVYLNETIELMKQRVEYSEELLTQIELRYKSNLVDAIDLLRSREALLNSRQTLQQYKYRLTLLVKSLKDELSIDITGDTPDYDYFKTVSPETEGISISDIYDNRIFEINLIEKEKLLKTRKRYEYSGQPDLDLNINIGYSSREDNFNSSLTEQYPFAGLSLTYSGSITDEKNMNLIAETDSKIKNNDLKKISLLSEFKSEAESLLTQLEQNNELIQTQKELIVIAAEKTEEERKYYNQGRGELNYIIQSLDSETQQKIKMNDQILNLKKICLKLKELSDNLLVNIVKGE